MVKKDTNFSPHCETYKKIPDSNKFTKNRFKSFYFSFIYFVQNDISIIFVSHNVTKLQERVQSEQKIY